MILLRLTCISLLLISLSSCQSAAQKKADASIDKRALLHYRLGLDALHKGSVPKAFEELLISDKIKPKQPNTLDAIAYAWRLRGDNNQAKKYYNKALKANAGAATENNYGSLLVEMKEYKGAIKHLNKALDDPRYPNQALAFINLGDAYIGLNLFEKSVAAYRKAHMLEPTWTYPRIREAAAYVKFNQPNFAQALYETLLREDPTNQQALSELISLVKNKNNGLLKRYLQTFIQKTPNELKKAWAKDELAMLVKGRK